MTLQFRLYGKGIRDSVVRQARMRRSKMRVQNRLLQTGRRETVLSATIGHTSRESTFVQWATNLRPPAFLVTYQAPPLLIRRQPPLYSIQRSHFLLVFRCRAMHQSVSRGAVAVPRRS